MEHIRDRGKSEIKAAQVRLVIEGMAGYLVAVEPVPEPQPQNRWDDCGRYLEAEQ